MCSEAAAFSGGGGGGSAEALACVRRLMLVDDPRWLARLGACVSHERRVCVRRAEQLGAFDRVRLKLELDTLLEAFVFPLNVILRRGPQFVLAYRSPPLSLALLTLLAAWLWLGHLLHAALLPLLLALALLSLGSMREADRAAVLAAFARPRKPRARTMLEKLTKFRAVLGQSQLRLHRLNDVMLRLRALATWRDPLRSALLVGALLLLALVLSAVPARVLIALLLAQQFSRALRPPGRGVIGLAFDRFWDGIPLDAA